MVVTKMVKYQVVAEGGGDTEIEASSIEEIEQLATEWMQDGDWGTPRSYAQVYITELMPEAERRAREWVRGHADDDEMDDEELEAAFGAIFGRAPDAHDREQGLWSLLVSAVDADGKETGQSWSIEVIVGDDEDEPDCVEGQEHDWQSPEWLGGCRENPGVWGIGGTQIASQTVCSLCGAYRNYTSESTPGNCPRTPSVTTYEVADERSEEWVKEMTEGDA